MDEQTKALLHRALTFSEIAQALMNLEAPAFRAEILAKLQAAQPRSENGQDVAAPV